MREEIESFFDKMVDRFTNEEKDFSKINKQLDYCDIKVGDSILDLGCGTGVISTLLFKRSQRKVDAIDISPKMIQKAKELHPDAFKCDFRIQDFYTLCGTYDKIVAFDAYPHFLDLPSFKRKAYESLKEGGTLAVIFDLKWREINLCHKNCPTVSRTIKKAEEEKNEFADIFQVISYSKEDEDYRLILKKATI